MKKLYKIEGDSVSYAEAWVDGEKLTFHTGTLGDRGTKKISKISGVSDLEAIDNALAAARKEGFKELPIEAHKLLQITYKTSHEWGDETDLEKRHEVESVMNEELGWTGNGHCDGGDIGSGEMAVFSLVVDPVLALESVLPHLRLYGLIEEAEISSRDLDGKNESILLSREQANQYAAEDNAEPEPVSGPTTEEEWFDTTNIEVLLAGVTGSELTQRKCRLFALACCERIKNLFIHPDSIRAYNHFVDQIEGKADASLNDAMREASDEILGDATMMDLLEEGDFDQIEEMEGDVERIQVMIDLAKPFGIDLAAYADAADALNTAIDEDHEFAMKTTLTAAWAASKDGSGRTEESEKQVHCELFRDVFESPFTKTTLKDQWLTNDVVELAKKMYEARDFSEMQTLKQFLIDAGCDDNRVLDHCDKPIHDRGCWLIDKCLRK